ncbi:MAG: HAD family hydrolase [Nanoarchaeota archaeon]
MIKAFIFDLGGTLVTTSEAILMAIEKALQENGLEFKDRESVINVFGHSLFKDVQTAVRVSYPEADEEKIEEKIQQCYTSFQRLFPRAVISHFKVIPEVVEGLKILKQKGKKLAVLTAFERQEADFFLEQMGLREYFDVVLCTEGAIEPRPHPHGLFVVMSHLGLPPEECFYVGDTMLDVRFARNAGVKVICVKTGAQDNVLLEKEKPDYLMEDLKEMIQKLSQGG